MSEKKVYFLVVDEEGNPVEWFLPEKRKCCNLNCCKPFTAKETEYIQYCPECRKLSSECFKCGETILPGQGNLVEGKTVCSSCMIKYVKTCMDCGENLFVKKGNRGEEFFLCEKCTGNWNKCEVCNKTTRIKELEKYIDEEFEINYSKICYGCVKKIVNTVPININVNEETMDREIVEKKELPKIKVNGYFSYREGDIRLRELMKIIDEEQLVPKVDIYVFGVNSVGRNISIGGYQLDKFHHKFVEKNGIIVKGIERTGKEEDKRIKIGISRGLRDGTDYPQVMVDFLKGFCN